MTGKERCVYLKDLRRKAAKDNGIDYEPPECTFDGECKGTCPKCEAELASLTKQIAVLGVAVAMASTMVGCTPDIPDKDIPTTAAVTDSVTVTSVEETLQQTSADVEGLLAPEDRVSVPSETQVPDEIAINEPLAGDVEFVAVPETTQPSENELAAGVMAAPEPTEAETVCVVPEGIPIAPLAGSACNDHN